MPKQAPDVRRSNFDEVALGYAIQTAVAEANRCLNCKKPSCISGCPVEINLVWPGRAIEAEGISFGRAYDLIQPAVL